MKKLKRLWKRALYKGLRCTRHWNPNRHNSKTQEWCPRQMFFVSSCITYFLSPCETLFICHMWINYISVHVSKVKRLVPSSYVVKCYLICSHNFDQASWNGLKTGDSAAQTFRARCVLGTSSERHKVLLQTAVAELKMEEKIATWRE